MENKDKALLDLFRGMGGKFAGTFPAAAVAAVVIAFLLISCDLAVGQRYEPSIPLPTAIPIASIVEVDEEGDTVVVVGSDGKVVEGRDLEAYGNYQFALKWERQYSGVLSANADFSEDVENEENLEAIEAVYKLWLKYIDLIDPRPFYLISGNKYFDVWTENKDSTTKETLPMKLNNTGTTLVIQRYWPQALLNEDPPKKLTVEEWKKRKADRVLAFKDAWKKIKEQMAAIERSPFYEPYDAKIVGNQPFLTMLYKSMEDFIAYPGDAEEIKDDKLVDRGRWTGDDLNSDGETILYPERTTGKNSPKYGQLYELYFGHIPEKEEYLIPERAVYEDDSDPGLAEPAKAGIGLGDNQFDITWLSEGFQNVREWIETQMAALGSLLGQ